MLKKHASSTNFKKRRKELESLSSRIEAKIGKLEKIVNELTNSLS
jgi:exonuclease VII small subunit